MITGTPSSRIDLANSSSAAFAASGLGLGSVRALRMSACMRLDREASRRSSTTTRCE
jgi:hypothetical protein